VKPRPRNSSNTLIRVSRSRLGTILAVTIGVGLLVALPTLLTLLGLPTRDALLLRAASFAVLLVSVQLAIATLYRFGPARPPRHWRLFSTGAVTATLLWAVASFCFSLYVSYFASYDATYGALGAAVALLTWLYVSVYLILLGAELDAALAKAEGAARSPAEPRPIIPEAATLTARRKDTAR